MDSTTGTTNRKMAVSFDDAEGRRHLRVIDESWADDYAAEMRERGHTNVTVKTPVLFREEVRDAA